MNKLEKDIEAKLVQACKRLKCIPFKFVSPGNKGVPDRIIVTPTGVVWFVELKRPKGGRFSKLQKYHMAELRARHANVTSIKNEKELNAFLGALV